MPNDNYIEILDADILNDGNLILSQVNLSIKSGDLVYLVGRVGSGKSSIIKTLIGELPVLKGDVRVGDFNLRGIRKSQIPLLRRNIGVVFQDFQLLGEQTVLENLQFVLKCTGWTDSAKMNLRCTQVLKMVDMESKSHKFPHQLSGGEQQRVAIARALLNMPQVILADEPTGNLDAQTASGIMNILMKIHNEYRPTIIIVTHNRSLLENYPGRIILCANGECREINHNNENLNLNEKVISEDLPV